VLLFQNCNEKVIMFAKFLLLSPSDPHYVESSWLRGSHISGEVVNDEPTIPPLFVWYIICDCVVWLAFQWTDSPLQAKESTTIFWFVESTFLCLPRSIWNVLWSTNWSHLCPQAPQPFQQIPPTIIFLDRSSIKELIICPRLSLISHLETSLIKQWTSLW